MEPNSEKQPNIGKSPSKDANQSASKNAIKELRQNEIEEIISATPSSSFTELEDITPIDKDVDPSIMQSASPKLNTGTKTSGEKIKTKSKEGPYSAIKRVRTYKEDISEAVRSQKASLTSVAAAEQRRRAGVTKGVFQKPPVDFKKVGVILGSVALLTLGVGFIVYSAFFYEKEKVKVEQEIPSFVFVEEQKEIDITGKNARTILQKLGEVRVTTSIPLGQISHLYVTETTKDLETEETRIISAKDFLTSVRAQVSSSFLRSLDPSFMIGIHVFNQNQPFFIFKSNSYQHSFAGLLEWERTMYNDFFLFVGEKDDPILGAPVDPQTGEKVVLRENFEDRIIQNIDVRALESTSGDIKLLYAFPNQQTLIITTNENTLIELITRLHSVRVF